jgi:hypothetical protein
MNVRKIVKSIIPSSLFKRIEPFGHLIEAVFFNLINGFPARGMKVIGVTGTNGKTTTTFMIHRMLTEAGYKTGIMTTVAYGVGDDIKPQVQHMTNVPVPELMKRLKFMRSQGIDWLVFEVTSQGLAQNRVWGVPFSVAVLTNITHEHLDYHGTFFKIVIFSWRTSAFFGLLLRCRFAGGHFFFFCWRGNGNTREKLNCFGDYFFVLLFGLVK